MSGDHVPVPPERARGAQEIAKVLKPGLRVALTTHVNADGDGLGSEVGLWYLLRARGLHPTIANPTPPPERFDFLLPESADGSAHAVKEIERADVIMVLDISDLGRLGDLAHAVRARGVPVACIDHHVSPGSLPAGPRLVAPEAGLAWVTVPPDALQRHGATPDDLDGIVEFPRTIAGVRLALLFRQVASGRIKVSLRSMGDVNAADLAHRFGAGGGGHAKAAGVSFEGSLAEVQGKVLAAAREYLQGKSSSV